jgi:hypothetical protein
MDAPLHEGVPAAIRVTLRDSDVHHKPNGIERCFHPLESQVAQVIWVKSPARGDRNMFVSRLAELAGQLVDLQNDRVLLVRGPEGMKMLPG